MIIELHNLFMFVPDITPPGSWEDYEANEIRLIRQAIRPTDTVIEIGAGIGLTTCILARLAASVIAFEPDVRNYDYCNLNLFSNHLEDKVRLYNDAIGPHNTELELNLNQEFWNSSLLPHTMGQIIGTSHVNVIGIQYLLSMEQANVLVLDCEGAEVAILRYVPDHIRTVLVETHAFLTGIDVLSIPGFEVKLMLGQDHVLGNRQIWYERKQ